MQIKNLRDISKKDLEYFSSHEIYVTEKLDLVYFKVCVSDDGQYVKNSKGHIINYIDCIVNDINKNIMDFVGIHIYSKIDEFRNAFGEFSVGFFYKPNNKTNVINYDNLNGDFILSDLFTYDKSLKNSDLFLDMLGGDVLSYPLIKVINGLPKIDFKSSDLYIANQIIGKSKTFSGNPIIGIEGIILSSGGKKYKIIINDAYEDIEMTTKKLYRDTIIEDFCNVIYNDGEYEITCKGNSYEEKIYNAFLEYINNTEIFTKMFIEPEDLLPPKNGYFGDIYIDSLPNTVQLVCKNNEVFKNILRILLVTFYSDKIEKFDYFSDNYKNRLNELRDFFQR